MKKIFTLLNYEQKIHAVFILFLILTPKLTLYVELGDLICFAKDTDSFNTLAALSTIAFPHSLLHVPNLSSHRGYLKRDSPAGPT